jgi:hypothetical protein
LIVGGSGQISVLIDGLANSIERNVKNWPADIDEEAARLRIEGVLRAYNVRQIKEYPDELDDEGKPISKVLDFVICVKRRNSSDIFLWKAASVVIETVSDYALVGWDEFRYHHEIRWLHNPRTWKEQAVILGIRLLAMAQATNNTIKEPFQVITVTESGMKEYDLADVRVIQGRVEEWNRKLAEIVLMGIDMSQPEAEVLSYFKRFEEDTFALRAWFTGRTSIIDDNRMWDAIRKRSERKDES